MYNILKQKMHYLLTHRDKNVIGQRLRKQRKKNGYTQEEAANLIDIKRATLRQYESGRIIPPKDKIEKLALLYDCDPSWLYGWNEIPLITTMTSMIIGVLSFSFSLETIVNAASIGFLSGAAIWQSFIFYLKNNHFEKTEDLHETLSEEEKKAFQKYKEMNHLLLDTHEICLEKEKEELDKYFFAIFYACKILKDKKTIEKLEKLKKQEEEKTITICDWNDNIGRYK